MHYEEGDDEFVESEAEDDRGDDSLTDQLEATTYIYYPALDWHGLLLQAPVPNISPVAEQLMQIDRKHLKRPLVDDDAATFLSPIRAHTHLRLQQLGDDLVSLFNTDCDPRIKVAVRTRLLQLSSGTGSDQRAHYGARLLHWDRHRDNEIILQHLELIKLSKNGVVSGAVYPIRSVFYILKGRFKSQDESNARVNQLACTLGLRRRDLNFSSNSRGKWTAPAGSVKLTMINNTSIWSRGWHESVPTDLDLVSVEIVPDTIDAIVLIEKDAMYQRLNTIIRNRVLLMTGCGNPDFSIRNLLKMLHNQCPRLPVLVYTDCDVGGIQIFLTIHNSSREATNEDLAVPAAQWRGVCPSDWKDEPDIDLTPFNEARMFALQNMLSMPDIQVPANTKIALRWIEANRTTIHMDRLPIEDFAERIGLHIQAERAQT